jgi:glycosyltransferase involved in cell wall biosynthesis
MKVCIIRNSEAETNAGIIRVIDALQDESYQISLLTRSRYDNGHTKKIKQQSISIKGKNLENFEIQLVSKTGRGLKNIFQLIVYELYVTYWLIKNRNMYDVIHPFDLDAGLPAAIVSKIFKKKLVYHIADFYVDSRPGIPSKLKKLIKNIEYFIISRATSTIICTEERIKQIEGSHPRNLVIVHNSPTGEIKKDNEALLPKENNKKEKLKLCYVGDLSERRFIKNVLEVISQDERFELEIAGMGPLSELVEEYSHSYNNIKYYGRIKYQAAIELYSKCDLMFAIYDPSVDNHKYSAPNKAYEAMMLGKPIIVAKGTSIDKIVEREKLGVVINFTKEDFMKVLGDVYKEQHLIWRYSENAISCYKHYSWTNMRKRIIKLYKGLK